MEIAILDIIEDTATDGPGLRTSVYCAGCNHRCPGSHNPQSWDSGRGHMMETGHILHIIQQDEFADVTFSGGDPMLQAPGFAELARLIKTHTRKNIWCYTGFRYETLLASPEHYSLLENIDVLVDGPYIEAQRDEALLFRGSRNQRLIDIPASLEAHGTVLYTYSPFP